MLSNTNKSGSESTINVRFRQFHVENPHVYGKLRELSLFAKNSGAKRIGIALLFERLRWFSMFETSGDQYKLNNTYRALYARLLMKNVPELYRFFELRERRSDHNNGHIKREGEMKIGYTRKIDTDNLHPAGSFAAVCTRVLDLGDQETIWNGETKTRPMLRVYWKTPEGSVSRRYATSMHERSTLRRDLESWRGKRFSDQEADDFDTDSILQQAALLTVMHHESGGRTYANIVGVAPLPSSMSAPDSEPHTEETVETW